MSEIISKTSADVYHVRGGQYADWITVIIEPCNKYSAGGGRITVNIGDDNQGSHFFPCVGPKTFIEFIAGVSSEYLEDRLFKSEWTRPLQTLGELMAWLKTHKMSELKELRRKGLVSKERLRSVYDFLSRQEHFEGVGELWRYMDGDDCAVMEAICGDEWYYGETMCLPNEQRKKLLACVQQVINAFKTEQKVKESLMEIS
ncbi:hypothetical protein [Acinetobacter sp. ANC 3813]|uniref:hypothetical protein n=1 Tax=Acinetobacter sp. ANC 3813 TaxID=1977873 RepID=UPI000A338F25|nr:hypothetical protein [Acinetobacter sp. ANC 3813]OTG87836.1 hypothetical protein B9T34_15995 [Acinetobacter sp. ANC 3813]